VSTPADTVLAGIPAFERQQAERLLALGIDVSGYGVSHIAVRTRTWNEYLELREGLEARATANLENVWNGRPISKIVLAEPVALESGRSVSLIELIPPFHQRVYKMGIEHVGYIVGAALPEFIDTHFEALTGQQYQSRFCTPAYVLFPDYTHVKFYERGLQEVCELEGADFSVIRHADWEPADPEAGPYEVS
jgi:predicted metalloenzyme YecM